MTDATHVILRSPWLGAILQAVAMAHWTKDDPVDVVAKVLRVKPTDLASIAAGMRSLEKLGVIVLAPEGHILSIGGKQALTAYREKQQHRTKLFFDAFQGAKLGPQHLELLIEVAEVMGVSQDELSARNLMD